jgi:hypothetical protein
MKYKFVIFLILFSCFQFIGFSQKQIKNVKISVGQSVYQLPTPTKTNGVIDWHFADSITTGQLIKKAISEALEKYGNEKPKLLWIMGRTEDRQPVKAAIEANNPHHIPYIFDGSNWSEYTAIGPVAATHQQEQSFVVIAMGGTADYQFHYLHVPKLKDGYWELEQKYGKDSAAIILSIEKEKYLNSARKFANMFNTSTPGNKIFLQFGNIHTPKQNWVLEGISDVFKNINIIGGAQADWGWQIHDKAIIESALYGIMITGDFTVSQAMGLRNKEEPLHVQSDRILKSALNELKREPDYAVYIGCAGWNSDQVNQYDVLKKLLPNTAFFGRFSGGEIGRYNSDEPNQSGIDLLSVLFIANNNTLKK